VLFTLKKPSLLNDFFDESGGMQLTIHSLFGAPINKAWGLVLRKSFCHSFDIELQASASLLTQGAPL
jgi:ATP-dependent Lhr-like helicase